MNHQDCHEKTLLDQMAQLPQEIAPERDLWQGIELAIQHKPQDVHLGSPPLFKSNIFNVANAKAPLAWAATVIVAILLSWVTFSPEQAHERQFNLAASMQQNFEQQKQHMLVSLGQPDVSKLSVNMQNQFKQLASAQVTIKKALLNDPDNADLLNLLRWTQQQELDLLNQLYRPKWQTI
jgi:hypothetical protein